MPSSSHWHADGHCFTGTAAPGGPWEWAHETACRISNTTNMTMTPTLVFLWMGCVSVCLSAVSISCSSTCLCVCVCPLSALWNVILSLVSVDLFCHFKLPWVNESVRGLRRSSLSLSRLISLRRHSPIVVEACSAPLIGWSFWRAEPPGTALLLLSLARSFCLGQQEWMVGRKQWSRSLRGGELTDRTEISISLCLLITPLDVTQSFPHNHFSTAAEIQSCSRSCSVNVAVRQTLTASPAVAPRINHMRVLFCSISLGATLTWCFITRTAIIELSCGLPSAKQTTDLLLHCPSLYSGVSFHRKRHEYPIQSKRHLHCLLGGSHFN